MKTDDLVTMLANSVEAVDPQRVEKRIALALAVGLAGTGLLMLLLLGVRPDLGVVARTPAFWLKLAFPAVVLGGALTAVLRLARPGHGGGPGWVTFGVAVGALWVAGAAALALAPAAAWPHMLLGATWQVCSAAVALLSLPAFAMALWALRGLAPTRLREAGAAAGLLAGAEGLLVYCLHCPESAVTFWGLWYVLGMLVPALAGALLGRSWLRW